MDPVCVLGAERSEEGPVDGLTLVPWSGGTDVHLEVRCAGEVTNLLWNVGSDSMATDGEGALSRRRGASEHYSSKLGLC